MPQYSPENSWHNRLKVAVGQINVTVGDFPGNAEKILNAVDEAARQGCNLIVFPEMCMTGGPAHDLLLRADFIDAQRSALWDLSGQVGEIIAVVGFVERRKEGRDKALYSSAALIFDGKIRRIIDKTTIEEQDGFDERRYLVPGEAASPLKINGVPVGILIGDDVFKPGTCEALVELGASVIIAPTSSSFRPGRAKERFSQLSDRARKANVDILLANLVGGQEELVFDGASFAVDAQGRLLWQAPQFEEGVFVVGASSGGNISLADDVEQVHQAICVAIRDFVQKTEFSKVVVGLSGGVDSALVAALAAKALGPGNVLGIVMPSKITSRQSVEDAKRVASNLGIQTKLIPIKPILEAYITDLREHLGDKGPDVALENLQARIRANILMAFANKFGYLVLCTGNRSESLVGYATLYGDMAGAFAPISDVPKTLVYRLAEHANREAQKEVIPQSVIEKEPSAELSPGQTDAQALGPYEALDPVLEAYVDQRKALEEIVNQGLDPGIARNAVQRFYNSQFKRYQAPPGPRIVSASTAWERRMPIVNRFSPWSRPSG